MKNLFLFLIAFFICGVFFQACGEGGTETGNPTEGENSDDGSGESDDGGDDSFGPASDDTDEEQTCLDAGGEWIEFSDGCADSCESQREEGMFCTQSLTEGCECGDDMCWTGSECEEI